MELIGYGVSKEIALAKAAGYFQHVDGFFYKDSTVYLGETRYYGKTNFDEIEEKVKSQFHSVEFTECKILDSYGRKTEINGFKATLKKVADISDPADAFWNRAAERNLAYEDIAARKRALRSAPRTRGSK